MNEEKPACLITFSVSACAFHQMDADYAQPGQQIFTRSLPGFWLAEADLLWFLAG